MTKFEELQEIIARKKNKGKNENKNELDSHDNLDLEVVGSESSKAPLITPADDDQDGSIIDELYKPRHKPLSGYFAESWD